MKKHLFIILALLPMLAFGQKEPGNNLGISLNELTKRFPDLVVWGYPSDGLQNYKSPQANALFGYKNGKVVSEFILIEGNNGFERELYYKIVESFMSAGAHKSYLPANDGRGVILFYSYFKVYISYTPGSDVSLHYQLYSSL